jgi:hypothetical protein
MKVPDFSVRSDGNQNKCGIDCLANYSCTAYAYDPYIGCMYWSGELIDLQKFPYGGVVLFIRVPTELCIFSLFLLMEELFFLYIYILIKRLKQVI